MIHDSIHHALPEDAAAEGVPLQQVLQPRRQILVLPKGQSQAVSRHVSVPLILHAQVLRVQRGDPEVALLAAVRLDHVQAAGLLFSGVVRIHGSNVYT